MAFQFQPCFLRFIRIVLSFREFGNPEAGEGSSGPKTRSWVNTSWWFVYVRYMLNLSYLSVGSRLLFRSFAPTDPVGFRPCFPIDYVLWRFDACPQGSSWGGPRSVVQCPPLSSQRLKWFAIPEPKHLFRSNSLISRFFEIFFISSLFQGLLCFVKMFLFESWSIQISC